MIDGTREFVAEFAGRLEKRRRLLETMATLGRHCEGWFQGESLDLLETKRKKGEVECYEIASKLAPNSRKNADIRMFLPTSRGRSRNVLIELKHITDRHPWRNYFLTASPGVGYYFEEFQKLDSGVADEKNFVLIFTGKPDGTEFRDCIREFRTKFGFNGLQLLSKPDASPDYLMLAHFRIGKSGLKGGER